MSFLIRLVVFKLWYGSLFTHSPALSRVKNEVEGVFFIYLFFIHYYLFLSSSLSGGIYRLQLAQFCYCQSMVNLYILCFCAIFVVVVFVCIYIMSVHRRT